MPDPSSTITRRALLAGVAGAVGVAVLAACSSDGDGASSDASTGGDDSSDTTVAPYNLLALFPPEGLLVTGSEQRLPFVLAGADGAPLDEAPAALEFVVQTADGDAVGDPVTVDRRDQGLPTAYFPVLFEFPEAGDFQVTTSIDGDDLEPRVFRVAEADAVEVPQPGEPLPPVNTPTTAADQGFEPLCTRDPPCDLHEVSLTAALEEGGPVALLIATPAYCQTAICGPVLDVLLGQVDEFPDVRMLHAEVYENPEAVDNIADAELAPIIDAYSLSYEPVLLLANSDGTIATRLDTIFDESEVAEALQALTA